MSIYYELDINVFQQKMDLEFQLEEVTEELKKRVNSNDSADLMQLLGLCRQYVSTYEALAVAEKKLRDYEESKK